VLGEVTAWANRVKQEHDAPDLWALVGAAIDRRPADDVANTSFTAEEQAAIEEEIAHVKAYILESADLTESQASEVVRQLDYIAEASKRLPRLDWRNALLGVLLDLMLQSVVPPETIRGVLSLGLRGLAALYGSMWGGLPPPIP